MDIKNYNLIVVLGPTASGKTRFAACLANELDAEIVSADSRQVYKHMDLGTGKDYDDYLVGKKKIPFHLVDICDPGTRYNVFEFQNDFFNVYADIQTRGKGAILCGGTGMYIESITKGYKLIAVPVDEELRNSLKDKSLEELESILATYRKLHNKSDSDTKKRTIRAIEIEEYYKVNNIEEEKLPEIYPVYFGLDIDREVRRSRITERLKKRLKEGMVEEVEKLLFDGVKPEDLIYYGLEYKFLTLYLTGQLDYNSMVKQLNVAIHQFAKRQMTWFRKMEREGIKINWIDGMLCEEEKIKSALQILKT